MQSGYSFSIAKSPVLRYNGKEEVKLCQIWGKKSQSMEKKKQ